MSLDPEIVITEQPAARGYRYRYKCEGKTAGTVPGEKSTPKRKTVPTFRVNNVPSDYITTVVISCVTSVEPHRPHPHKLVGKDCNRGVCTMRMKKTNSASLQGIGIQCVKKSDIPISLEERKEIKVDPYETGFYEEDFTYNVKEVRFALQGFVESGTGDHKSFAVMKPVVTSIIYDCKTDTTLAISKIFHSTSPADGNVEIIVLCDKVNKDDIAVQFYETALDEDDPDTEQLQWEALADFSPNDVHKQCAIVCKTPPYRNLRITSAYKVWVRLYRPSDQATSEPKQFTYLPVLQDPYGVVKKRKLGFPGIHTTEANQLSTGMLPTVLHNSHRETKTGVRRSNHTASATITRPPPATTQHTIMPVQKTEDSNNTPLLDELMPGPSPVTYVAQSSNTQVPAVVHQFESSQPSPGSLPAVVNQSAQNHIITQPSDEGENNPQYLLNSLTYDNSVQVPMQYENILDDELLSYFNGGVVTEITSEDTLAAMFISGDSSTFPDMSKLQTDNGGVPKKKGRPKKNSKKSKGKDP